MKYDQTQLDEKIIQVCEKHFDGKMGTFEGAEITAVLLRLLKGHFQALQASGDYDITFYPQCIEAACKYLQDDVEDITLN